MFKPISLFTLSKVEKKLRETGHVKDPKRVAESKKLTSCTGLLKSIHILVNLIQKLLEDNFVRGT